MFDQLAVDNISEKLLKELWGMYILLWGARETIFHLSEKWKILIKVSEIILTTLANIFFVSRKTKSKIKKVRKGDAPPLTVNGIWGGGSTPP